MKNKLWYFEYATSEQFSSSCKNLQDDLELIVSFPLFFGETKFFFGRKIAAIVTLIFGGAWRNEQILHLYTLIREEEEEVHLLEEKRGERERDERGRRRE